MGRAFSFGRDIFSVLVFVNFRRASPFLFCGVCFVGIFGFLIDVVLSLSATCYIFCARSRYPPGYVPISGHLPYEGRCNVRGVLLLRIRESRIRLIIGVSVKSAPVLVNAFSCSSVFGIPGY